MGALEYQIVLHPEGPNAASGHPLYRQDEQGLSWSVPVRPKALLGLNMVAVVFAGDGPLLASAVTGYTIKKPWRLPRTELPAARPGVVEARFKYEPRPDAIHMAVRDATSAWGRLPDGRAILRVGSVDGADIVEFAPGAMVAVRGGLLCGLLIVPQLVPRGR